MFIIGTQDLGVEKKELSKNILRRSGTSSPLQEAIEYLEQELLTNRSHGTLYGGCAILFNKDTFFPDIKVSSIYLHDTRTGEQDKGKEGESGPVLQGVMSRAHFRQLPRGGESLFTTMSSHINNKLCQEAGHREDP